MIQKVERFEKQEAEKSVLMQLNYRHDMLFQKLSEAEERLTNVTKILGNEFPLNEEINVPLDVLSHLDTYSILLDKTENKLGQIFNTIKRLEYLCQ